MGIPEFLINCVILSCFVKQKLLFTCMFSWLSLSSSWKNFPCSYALDLLLKGHQRLCALLVIPMSIWEILCHADNSGCGFWGIVWWTIHDFMDSLLFRFTQGWLDTHNFLNIYTDNDSQAGCCFNFTNFLASHDLYYF